MEKAVNEELEKFGDIQKKSNELKVQRDMQITLIRDGLRDCVVVFIDLVGSTVFKTENVDEPEKWIFRQKIFLEIVAEYIQKTNGKVIKYIGDEVMGCYVGDTAVNDSLNLINRMSEMEEYISNAVEGQVQIKIAVDKGQVFFVKFDGHLEDDPQGTPVDRCARISKYLEPSTILTSIEYKEACPESSKWEHVGCEKLKGLGDVDIFQFGKQTISLEDTIEIPVKKLDSLNSKIDSLENDKEDLLSKNKSLDEDNKKLHDELSSVGVVPSLGDIVNENGGADCEKIELKIDEIRSLIKDSRIDVNDYSRFVFLYCKDEPGQMFNTYTRDFASCIDANLVDEIDDGFYSLNMTNKRNIKVIEKIKDIEFELGDDVNACLEGDGLYEFSFSDPEFWKRHMGMDVL